MSSYIWTVIAIMLLVVCSECASQKPVHYSDTVVGNILFS